MIYNSNGNNTPYQSGGNAKVQKELKALQEAINLVDANFNNYVDENDEDIVRIDNNIDAIELSVSDIGTRLSTAEGKIAGYDTLVETNKVQAQDADFHNVVAGKYVFQNGAAITGTNICKIADGSVVYATDGTNAILIDYTDKDAWVAKAKVEDNQYFRIYSNGVLTFTQSGGWSVYVLGNDFSTDDFTVPEETPIEVVTGVTIGGTLYAALARDYAFDNITVTSATINSATVTLLTAPSATITDLTATNETVADLTVTDEADINRLVNAKRNIQDEINGMISVDSHPTNVQVYIGVHKFTGTYNVKLTHEVNGAVQTLFTATIIWNGKYPIVQYHEYADNEPVDYLYSMVLTDDALYFVTQGAGNLYYSYDAMGGALAPTSSEYPNIPYQPNDVIADYITAYHDRTVFFGNHEDETGIDILGEMKADIIQLPDDFSITNMYVDNDLVVGGATTLTGDTTAGNITADSVESDELIGKSLQVKDGTDTYMAADENGVAVNVDTTITGDVNLTGDLTQTGDQDITGSVEISEKETINNLEPEEGGHYVDHNVWKLGTTFVDNNFEETTEPAGEAQTPVLLKDDVYKVLFYSSPNYYKYIVRRKQNASPLRPNPGLSYYPLVATVNGIDLRVGYDFVDVIDNTQAYMVPGDSFRTMSLYWSGNGDGVIPANKLYEKIDGEIYEVLGVSDQSQPYPQVHNTYVFRGDDVDATILQRLQQVTFVDSPIQEQCYYIYSYVQINNATEPSELLVTDYPEGTINGYNLNNGVDWAAGFTNPQSLYYVLYKEFVQEADPTHTYDATDEVLAVNGNEKVTRDLKVQGYIFQDDYHIAHLPNIKSKVIEVGDLD